MLNKITLIGSGHVATNIGNAMKINRIGVTDVFSFHYDHAKKLSLKLNSKAARSLDEITNDSDLILIAVNDDRIASVANALPDKSKLVAHTSGFMPMNIFEKAGFRQFGVFYPLQSLSKHNLITFDNVPFCIEGSDEKTAGQLNELAGRISRTVVNINTHDRQYLHLAAVFANNFSNHMFAIANEILAEHKLPFDLLKPLILRTAEKVLEESPLSQQTGPAVRNDQQTMEQQKRMLKNDLYSQLYELLNKSILQMKNKPTIE